MRGISSPKSTEAQRVPTVREFIEWIRETHLLINLALKDYPKDVGDEHAFTAADKLIDLIEEYGIGDRSMVNSFSDRALRALGER